MLQIVPAFTTYFIYSRVYNMFTIYGLFTDVTFNFNLHS